jgi:hypothetical protein
MKRISQVDLKRIDTDAGMGLRKPPHRIRPPRCNGSIHGPYPVWRYGPQRRQGARGAAKDDK